MKTKTAKIHSIWAVHDHGEPARSYSVEFKAEQDAGISTMLSQVWFRTNRDNRIMADEFPATSVGDVIELDGEFYFVDSFRFVHLEGELIGQALVASPREVCFGYDHWRESNEQQATVQAS